MNNVNKMMLKAAELLNNADGDGFDKLLVANENWMLDDDSKEAMASVLEAMQEAAFLNAGFKAVVEQQS